MLAQMTAENQQEEKTRTQEEVSDRLKPFGRDHVYSARIFKYVSLELFSIHIWQKWFKFQAAAGLNIYSATYLLVMSLGKKLDYLGACFFSSAK